ncbi:MAG: hypothetical protein ACERKK_07390, partial [Poseidonibacter sp.]|uniref:hypothetical protein n=1 Tax=Poseidonibacter sp. TaxID=2321188 RepID=UPI00359EBA16
IEQTGSNTYVYNEEYCEMWFNNYDKKTNLPRKQLFGSFYDFGHAKYLLHIEVATFNLHIGFIEYKKYDSKFKVIKMNEENRINLKKFINSLNYDKKFEGRTWGLGWVSLDCGKFIDFMNSKTFVTLVDFKRSEFYKEILLPLLKKL